MHSFDKDVHRAALAKMPKDANALVLAAQNLTMTSAAKRLKHFGEGKGRCPFCDSLDSGIIHEAWACPHFKEVQNMEDEYLNCLGPGKVDDNILLGLPNQLEAECADQILQFKPGMRPDNIN